VELESHLSFLKNRYDLAQEALESSLARSSSLSQSAILALNNVPYLVRLKVGQDEVSPNFPSYLTAGGSAAPYPAGTSDLANKLQGAHPWGGTLLPDYSEDAVLLPFDLVESVNADVRKLGWTKVAALESLRDSRKKLLYQAWEAAYLQACLAHEQALHRDYNLLRAVGPVKEFLEGKNLPASVRSGISRKEAGIALVKKTHKRASGSLLRSCEALEKEIASRKEGIVSLEERKKELVEAVGLREALLSSKTAGASATAVPSLNSKGGASGSKGPKAPPIDKHMKSVTTRANLSHAVKAQSAEIAALQDELMRAQRRNFVQL